MAHEYAHFQDIYLQPPAPQYHHHYDIAEANTNASAPYELTAGAGVSQAGAGAAVSMAVGGAGACAAPAPVPRSAAHLGQAHAPPPHLPPQHLPPHHAHHYHTPCKRDNHYNSDSNDLSSCSSSLTTATVHTSASATRKRKSSSYGTASTYDDDGNESVRPMRSHPDKKQNHSEIEKRRRDKMNTYILELSAIVPMCGAMARKLDKLTVLRMAMQHMRAVRGGLSACPLRARPMPAFLQEQELNALVLHAARDSFLLVVDCDRGRLLYASASVRRVLHYDHSELLGQSLFDILHPKDVAKVKEQLSSSDLSPRERLIDAKTMLPVKTDLVMGTSRFCPGARRSFFCRIKYKAASNPASSPASATATDHAPDPVTTPQPAVKEEAEVTTKLRKKHNEKKYCVVQCTGYLKSWAPAEVAEGAEEGECSLSCLVAVGRALPELTPPPAHWPPPPAVSQTPSPGPTSKPSTRRLQYVSRHAIDGKFLFVDQRVTLALGFVPQELLGSSLYEFVGASELGGVAAAHKAALFRRSATQTPPYTFRRKDGTLATIQTHFKPFKNPWTKEVECLVAMNTILAETHTPTQPSPAQDIQDVFKLTASGSGVGVGGGGVGDAWPPTSAVELAEDECAPADGAFPLSEADLEMQLLIASQVESHKIGNAIAEEAMRRASPPPPRTSLPALLVEDALFTHQPQELCYENSLVDGGIGVEMANYSQVRNNVPLSMAGSASTPPAEVVGVAEDGGAGGMGDRPRTPDPESPLLALGGNGEAAMAVILGMLEADAGLGGPINFSGLPWPLP